VKRVDSSGGQMTSCLPFHQQTADELGGDDLGGADEEGWERTLAGDLLRKKADKYELEW